MGACRVLTTPIVSFLTALTTGCSAGSMLAGYTATSDVFAINFLAFNCAAGIWVNEPTM